MYVVYLLFTLVFYSDKTYYVKNTYKSLIKYKYFKMSSIEFTGMKGNSISEPMHEEMEVDLDVENYDPWIPMHIQSPDSNVESSTTR